MFWFPLALLGAISQATYSFSVKVLLRWIPPFFLAGYSFLAASLVLFSLILFSGIPPLGPGLVPAVAATVAINTVATLLFYRALSTTDLSLCVPMLAFTPVFLILTSFIILGEIPSPAGVVGIFLVATGAFLLTQKSGHGQSASLLTPFLTLRHDQGVRSMLIVAFLYSLSVNYDKEVVINSSPIFGSALIFFLLAIIFLLIAVSTGTTYSFAVKDPLEPDPVPSHSPFPYSRFFTYGAVGMILATEGISINTAYTMAIVPYVITIKRLSIFFSVLFGGLLLHEQYIRGRMFGAVVMITGAVVIGLWG
jgi:drug/metabolite transporter (DMT)-like permease